MDTPTAQQPTVKLQAIVVLKEPATRGTSCPASICADLAGMEFDRAKAQAFQSQASPRNGSALSLKVNSDLGGFTIEATFEAVAGDTSRSPDSDPDPDPDPPKPRPIKIIVHGPPNPEPTPNNPNPPPHRWTTTVVARRIQHMLAITVVLRHADNNSVTPPAGLLVEATHAAVTGCSGLEVVVEPPPLSDIRA